jgi:hypothetical protein
MAAGIRQPSSGFLGKAVGSIHDPDTIEFWKKTFTEDVYVKNILREGYKFPLKCHRRSALPSTERGITRALVRKWILSVRR